MDHLPRVSNPLHAPTQVPCLLTELYSYKYDFKGFESFPLRCGWSEKELLDGTHEREAADVAAFLQSWLYFGLLGEVFKINNQPLLPAIESLLVSNDPQGGSRLISTANLVNVIRRWVRHWGLILHAARLADRETLRIQLERRISDETGRIDDIMHTAFRIVTLLLTKHEDGAVDAQQTPLPASVVFSISIAGETVALARNSALVWGSGYLDPALFKSTSEELSSAERILLGEGSPLRFGSDATEKNYDWGPWSLFDDRFPNGVWCPSEKFYLQRRLGAASTYYASQLRRYRRPRDHQRCTDYSCLANQTKAGYQLQHSDECSSNHCDLVALDNKDIERIVLAGNIPLLEVQCEDADWRVIVTEFVPGLQNVDYVAFSHVWADGLGNETDNLLTSCQISRLGRLASQPALWSSAPRGAPGAKFWIDTLCVPVEPESLRKKAIENMANVYSMAARVLVLDSELQQISSRVPFQEIMIRIHVSAWNRRLWTLQEGALATQLVFQLQDRPVDLEILLQCRIEDNTAHTQPLTWQATNDLMSYRLIMVRKGSERCAAVSRALQFRSVSKAEDEAICMSTLLGIDVRPILDIPASSINQRMEKVWSTQKEVPQTVVAVPFTRLSGSPYRWAPRSFMGGSSILYNSRLTCQFDGQALKISCPGFLLAQPLKESTREVFIMATKRTLEYGGWMLQGFEHEGKPLPAIKTPAVIIPDPHLREPSPAGEVHHGIIVDVLATDHIANSVRVAFHGHITLVMARVGNQGFAPRGTFRDLFQEFDQSIGQVIEVTSLLPDPDFATGIHWLLTGFPDLEGESSRVLPRTLGHYMLTVSRYLPTTTASDGKEAMALILFDLALSRLNSKPRPFQQSFSTLITHASAPAPNLEPDQWFKILKGFLLCTLDVGLVSLLDLVNDICSQSTSNQPTVQGRLHALAVLVCNICFSQIAQGHTGIVPLRIFEFHIAIHYRHLWASYNILKTHVTNHQSTIDIFERMCVHFGIDIEAHLRAPARYMTVSQATVPLLSWEIT